MLLYNRDKYIFIYRRMPPQVYDNMIKLIKPLHKNLSDLIDEIEAYRNLMVCRLKDFVNDRTKAIVQLASKNKSKGIRSIKDYTINVTQTVTDPNIDLGIMNLPRPVRKDTKTDNVFQGTNPYDSMVEEIQKMKYKNLDKLYGGKEDIKFDKGNIHDQTFAIGQVAEQYNIDDFKKRKLIDRKRENLEEKDLLRKKYEMERRKRFEEKRRRFNRFNMRNKFYRHNQKGLI